jgi:hypothetical protein
MLRDMTSPVKCCPIGKQACSKNCRQRNQQLTPSRMVSILGTWTLWQTPWSIGRCELAIFSSSRMSSSESCTDSSFFLKGDTVSAHEASDNKRDAPVTSEEVDGSVSRGAHDNVARSKAAFDNDLLGDGFSLVALDFSWVLPFPSSLLRAWLIWAP